MGSNLAKYRRIEFIFGILARHEMFQELDTIVLTHDIHQYGLKQGDIGAVVHCYKDNTVFEVKFATADGKTIALLTLDQADIRPIGRREVLHVRELSEVVT